MVLHRSKRVMTRAQFGQLKKTQNNGIDCHDYVVAAWYFFYHVGMTPESKSSLLIQMPDRCHDGFRNWADQESVVDIGLMYSNPKQIEKWEHRETQIYTSHGFFYPFGGYILPVKSTDWTTWPQLRGRGAIDTSMWRSLQICSSGSCRSHLPSDVASG